MDYSGLTFTSIGTICVPCMQAVCPAPARLVLSGAAALQSVQLAAPAEQQEGQQAAAVTVPLQISNAGGAPLALSFSVRSRSGDLLQPPHLWLDTASGAAGSLLGSDRPCNSTVRG